MIIWLLIALIACMPIGVNARLKRLESRWSTTHRYVDAACRLIVCKRSNDPDDNSGVPTGLVSPIIGGVWDRYTHVITPDLQPKRIIEARVSLEQYGYVLDTTTRLMGKGGRGGGKSEALAEKCRYVVLSNPHVANILILSPDYPHTELMWSKVYRRLHPWIYEVRTRQREFVTIFGCIIKFMSAHLEKSVRGFGAAVGLLDEEKDISAQAYDNFLLCIRLGGRNPHIAGVGTPEAGGEYEQRWNAFATDPHAAQHSFPSHSNPFISPKIFEIAKASMDEKRYRQEVLAEFVAMNEDQFVFRAEFAREIHGVKWPMLGWADATRNYTAGRTGKAYRWIAGVDYNDNHPNVAWMYRVYDCDGAKKRCWVLHDIVKSSGTADWLAQALIAKGYNGQNTIVVDDASSEYNAPGGKKAPNTASRLMRARGFLLLHPQKNPPVRDRTHAFLAKLRPAVGDPTWYYDASNRAIADTVERTAMLLKWKQNGKELDKDDGVDHDYDAGTYPIAHFEPAAAIAIPRTSGIG